MFHVPSVTMKGGSRSRATRKPFTKPQKPADAEARQQGDNHGHAVADHHVAHDDEGEDHDDADGEVDAGGKHDERLRGGEDADDGDLLHDQRERVGGEEAFAARNPEEDDERHEHDQRHQAGLP